MLQLIGIVITVYVFTRCVEIAKTTPHTAVGVLAWFSAAITALAGALLVGWPGLTGKI